MSAPARVAWKRVTERAARIARSYGTLVTLRQVFYRLVSEALIENTRQHYKRLSDHTAKARRAGWFPALRDSTRGIEQDACWDSLAEALGDLSREFRLPRMDGQQYLIFIGGEKRTLAEQLRDWFGEYGVPRVVLAGYPSQTPGGRGCGLHRRRRTLRDPDLRGRP